MTEPVRAWPGEITPPLVGWAYRVAGAYAAAYGDPAGEFAAAVMPAAIEAARRWRPDRGPFAPHLRVVVRARLGRVLRRKGRRPGMLQIDGIADGSHPGHPESAAPPVGWEVDYEDYVGAVAARVGGTHGALLRTAYLDCRGGSAARAGAVHGLTHRQALNALNWAITKARRAFAREAAG